MKEESKSSIISDFLFTFVLTFFMILTLVMLGSKLLGFHILTVDSGSMEPNLPENSLIFVRQAEPSELQKDDIITFTIDVNGTLATHRIIGIRSEDRLFITKGDANDTYDVPVSWSNVVGKVELCLPKIGGVFRMVTAKENRLYVFIAIGILFGLMVFWGVKDIIKKKKRMKAEKAIQSEMIEQTEKTNKQE